MLPEGPGPRHHTSSLDRREWLQVGFSSLLGLGLPSLFAGRAGSAEARRPASVIIVWLTGAPSHLDTFDPKPDAPKEIRGEFRTIATRVPGLHFSEHLPHLAARTDHFAVVRS